MPWVRAETSTGSPQMRALELRRPAHEIVPGDGAVLQA